MFLRYLYYILQQLFAVSTVIVSSPRKEVDDPQAFHLHAALLRQARHPIPGSLYRFLCLLSFTGVAEEIAMIVTVFVSKRCDKVFGSLCNVLIKCLGLSCGSELTRQGISLPQDRYSYDRRSPGPGRTRGGSSGDGLEKSQLASACSIKKRNQDSSELNSVQCPKCLQKDPK